MENTSTLMHLEELPRQAQLWEQVCAHKAILEQKESHLQLSIAELKRQQELHPEVVAFLEKFQEHTHKKAVGVYEELLSAIVNEVLPPGNRSIALSLSTERGLPALDVKSIKGRGQEESILSGSGGSLVNVISAGLRIIALARSSHTPFLLLDEADCWLKESRVERFGTVIGQVAQDIGVQVFMISHKDPHYFDKYSTLVRLEHNSKKKKLESVVLSEPANGGQCVKVEPERNFAIKEKKIASIHLENFMSHKDTMIPLGETVTCFIGENDLGKSAVASALRSVFYGDSEDGFVRHGEKSCKVSLLLNSGEKIVFEHFLRKSPKRAWSLFVGNSTTPMMDAFPKYGAPEWLGGVFCVKRFEGLDVQLANQKEPVFLLNESASKRASILSIGSESHTLQKMILLHKENHQTNNALLKTQEQELGRIVRQLQVLKEYAYLGAELEDLKESAKDLTAKVEHLKGRRESWETYAKTKAKASVAVPSAESGMRLPHQTLPLKQRIETFRKVQQLGRIPVSRECPTIRLQWWQEKRESGGALLCLRETLNALSTISPVGSFQEETRSNRILGQALKDAEQKRQKLALYQKWYAVSHMHYPKESLKEKSMSFAFDQKRSALGRRIKIQSFLRKMENLPLLVHSLDRVSLPFLSVGSVVRKHERFGQLNLFLEKWGKFSTLECSRVEYQETMRLRGLLGQHKVLTEAEGKIKKATEGYVAKKIKTEEKLKEVHLLLGGVCPLCTQTFRVQSIKDLSV